MRTNNKSNTGLDDMTHFYCEVCGSIQETYFDGAKYPDISNNFAGGDIVCKKCSFVIATAYKIGEY